MSNLALICPNDLMKAYIIYLPEIPHSVEIANEAVIAAGQFRINAELFPGINGLYCKDLFEIIGIKKLLSKNMKVPGVQGCFLSHFKLWQYCVEIQETILILEHDGILLREIPLDVEKHFTEILNLDPCDQFSDEYNENILRTQLYPIEYNSLIHVNNKHHLAGYYIPGAYGYLIKPKGAQKLIDWALKKGALPTDKHIGTNTVDIKITSVPVVRLHKFYNSTNIKKFSGTKHLEKFMPNNSADSV
jgi:GR25 family glycosyltransferase involved in LPS biosynthesis